MPTTFDFSADGGLLPAAELCAGVGECRKKRGGHDVPVVPGDPRRAAQHPRPGQRPAAGAHRPARASTGSTDPAVHEVLDLCLECKACKSECPTNVDMARLKAEFLHQYHREHGLPLRNRVFGHVAASAAGAAGWRRCRTGWRGAGSAAG